MLPLSRMIGVKYKVSMCTSEGELGVHPEAARRSATRSRTQNSLMWGRKGSLDVTVPPDVAGSSDVLGPLGLIDTRLGNGGPRGNR